MIPMQLNFDGLEYVVGGPDIVEMMSQSEPLAPFDEKILNFLGALSSRLMAVGRQYPDVATFGFWCRKAFLLKEKSRYDDLDCRLGRGIVFHSTPSNVPVNFAYSLAAGLLAGNANIVRLPGKDFQQVGIICREIALLLNGEYATLKPYICLVKYASKQEIHDFFSLLCNTRVVWGGDQTVANFRRSPLQPRANEITFADRYSFLVVNADCYLDAKDKDKLTQDFYNDTFLSDQNACTSPCIVVWLGNNKEAAQKVFWDKIEAKVSKEYKLAEVQAVGKLDAFYQVAAVTDIQLVSGGSNFIYRMKLSDLSFDIERFKYNSGFFFEYNAEKLEDILPLCRNKCQTMTYLGLERETLSDFFASFHPKGIDRVVPMGKSMDFSLVWDGYDLIREMSRKISIL